MAWYDRWFGGALALRIATGVEGDRPRAECRGGAPECEPNGTDHDHAPAHPGRAVESSGPAHESTAGLMVAVVPAAVAVMAVNDGILNQLLAQAAGAVVFIVMLFDSVTTNVELGLITSGVVSVWEVPLVAVEYRQVTEAVHALVVVSVELV